MHRKPFSRFVQAAIITLSIGVFAILWPIAAMALLDAIPGQTYADIDVIGGFYAMMCVGIPLGVHMGLLLSQRTLWLPNRATRICFLFFSALFALFITLIDSEGAPNRGGDPLYKVMYFLIVQALPIFWFAYNLHGGMWMRMYTQRQRRLAGG